MKHITLILTIIMVVGKLAAQAPQGINYQAVARNADTSPKANATLTVGIKIKDALGADLYTESHTATTNGLGLFNLTIGQGSNPSTPFSNLTWASGSKLLEVIINGQSGGTQPLLSVPYALYAEKTPTTSQFTYIGPPEAVISIYSNWVDVPSSIISATSQGQYLILLEARVTGVENTEGLQFRIVNAITNTVLLNTNFRTGGGQESHWTFAGLNPSNTYKLQVQNDGNGSAGTFTVNRVQIGLFRLY